jgi:hypothetical protein
LLLAAAADFAEAHKELIINKEKNMIPSFF